MKSETTQNDPEDTISAVLSIIQIEQLSEGDKIGSERELAERLNVSRWHIRKALSKLENDGVILRTFGRAGGIFVAPKRLIRESQPVVSVPEFLRTHGLEAGTTVLESKLSPSDTRIANLLNLDQGEWVLRLLRLRVARGIPLNLETNIFPARLFPNLQNMDLSKSLYDLLESEYHLSRGEATEEISARSARPDESELLQIAQNSPLLIVDRTARTSKGEIFEYSEEIYRADRISITVRTHARSNAKQTPFQTVELVNDLK